MAEGVTAFDVLADTDPVAKSARDDAATWLILPIVLLWVGIFASALPAWRASRIEPMTVLRDE